MISLTKIYSDNYVRIAATTPVPEWELTVRRLERHGHTHLAQDVTRIEQVGLDMNEIDVLPSLISRFA